MKKEASKRRYLSWNLKTSFFDKKCFSKFVQPSRSKNEKKSKKPWTLKVALRPSGVLLVSLTDQNHFWIYTSGCLKSGGWKLYRRRTQGMTQNIFSRAANFWYLQDKPDQPTKHRVFFFFFLFFCLSFSAMAANATDKNRKHETIKKRKKPWKFL